MSQLLPQMGQVNADHGDPVTDGPTEDVPRQIWIRHHTAGMASQELQQVELEAGEPDQSSFDVRLIAIAVERD
jgi:hypothetical protein